MYSLPIDFNLSQLNGAIVQQVCFAANNISVMLDSSRYISFEGQFILTEQSGKKNKLDVYPVTDDSGLLKLLEQKIEKVSASKLDNNLFILFENQISLTILASDNYESYTIKTDNCIIRV
jgi:hypothetical protein